MNPTDLPPDVTAADLDWKTAGESLPYARLKELGLDYDTGWTGELTFYKTDKFGWVLCTLPISKAKHGAPPRTYGIKLKGDGVVTVGKGPHVKAVITVLVRAGNHGRLAKYVELWKKGMADAGGIRDRISSRRAQGQVERAAGKTRWRWDS